MTTAAPDRIFTDAVVYTVDPSQPWAEAFAVTNGRIVAVGTAAEVGALAGPDTEVVRLGGRFVMPGLNDVHVHLGIGGNMLAWEIDLAATDTRADIMAKVRDRAATLGPDEWVLGAAVNGAVMTELCEDASALDELDEAAGGRPVILRDDSQHNRWVSSATLRAMGVTEDTPDPEGNRYVRDANGRLTGWLFELEVSALAEDAFHASVTDLEARNKVSIAAAVKAMNAVGITGVQDAGTMAYQFRALRSLEEDGALGLRVVTSTPMLPFVEPGVTGEELQDIALSYRSERIRPSFAKFFIDGVPMTRTAFMLDPYICHDHTEDPEFRGEPYWSQDDLVAALGRLSERGIGAKMHAIGDASVRHVLDAVQRLRSEIHTDVLFQSAHVGIVKAADRDRFAEVGVIVDASPYLWFPSEFDAAIAQQLAPEALSTAHPHKSLVQSGAVVAAGSDWPVGSPVPVPWLGLQTLVTRRNPNPEIAGSLDISEALSLAEAINAFTHAPAVAMGLGDVTGRLSVGMSADAIVLDRNLFDVRLDSIHETAVLAVYLEGEKVVTA